MTTLIERSRAKAQLAGRSPLARLGVILLAALAMAALLLSASPASADDDDREDYSMYNLSSSVSTYFGNTMSPDSNERALGDNWGSILDNPANAGAFLGYADPDKSDLLKWATSQLSGSSGSIGYSQFKDATTENGESGGHNNGMLDYAHFGATLSGLGLDSTSTSMSSSMFKSLSGGVILLLLLLAFAIDGLFTVVIKGLAILNPFRLFYDGVKAVSPEFVDGMTGGAGLPAPLQGLGSWIGGWYAVLVNLSWTIMVPLMLGFLILGLLLFKKMDKGSAIKKFAVRILFIGLGLPVLGGMYTTALTSMDTDFGASKAGSAQVVMSTYVDFEGWVNDSRLEIPDDCGAVIEWDTSRDQPSAEAMMGVRNTALCINSNTNGYGALTPQLTPNTADSWTQSIIDGADEANNPGTHPGGPGNNMSANPASQFMNMYGMLVRYMDGQTFSASDFETSMKGSLSSYADKGDEQREAVRGWFVDYTPKNSKDLKDNNAGSNPMLAMGSDVGLTATRSGGVKTFTTENTSCLAFSPVSSNPKRQGEAIECNLSPLAMYNYLNTSFASDSLVTYSSEKAASGAIRESHSSVNQVGTGSMKFLYWVNAVVLLLSFVLIGFGYALSLLFANLKRAVQLIGAIPFATIGVLSGIAKVISYSVALILEVILTIFVYVLMQNLLLALPQIVEAPLSLLLNNDGGVGAAVGLTFLATSGLARIVVTVISIVVIVWFTVTALRVRKTIIKSINEAVTKIVEKFTGAEVSGGGGAPGMGGMLPGLAGGAAMGAGSALANRGMNKLGGGSKGSSSKSGAKGQGPGSIGVGGIPGMGAAGNPAANNMLNGGDNISGMIGPGGGDPKDPNGPNDPPPPGGGALPPGGNGPDGPDDDDPNDPNDPNGPNPPGGGAMGAGDGVSAPSALGSSDDAKSDKELADNVSAQGGLGAKGVQGDGTEGAGQAAKNNGDLMEGAVATAEHDKAIHKEQDKAAMEQATAGAKTVGKAGEAVARGYAGDAAGAVGAGADALGQAQKGQEAGQKRKELGKQLDEPTPKPSGAQGQQAQQSQQAQSGQQAAAAASQSSGKSLGSQGGATPTRPTQGSKTPTAKAPSGSQPSGGGATKAAGAVGAVGGSKAKAVTGAAQTAGSATKAAGATKGAGQVAKGRSGGGSAARTTPAPRTGGGSAPAPRQQQAKPQPTKQAPAQRTQRPATPAKQAPVKQAPARRAAPAPKAPPAPKVQPAKQANPIPPKPTKPPKPAKPATPAKPTRRGTLGGKPGGPSRPGGTRRPGGTTRPTSPSRSDRKKRGGGKRKK